MDEVKEQVKGSISRIAQLVEGLRRNLVIWAAPGWIRQLIENVFFLATQQLPDLEV
ncbi:hypothetical protein VE00_02048 [Pseudogymnoascus sp. WSF 3629]|nr:hypothetical protein VE00_02048 [Pseudogymnoascus sp. WSF 3629]